MSQKAEFYSQGIRLHWGIENRLHRVKDVQQNEDNNKVKENKIATNTSILQTQIINLFRMNGYKSLKYANERFANKVIPSFELIYKTLRI